MTNLTDSPSNAVQAEDAPPRPRPPLTVFPPRPNGLRRSGLSKPASTSASSRAFADLLPPTPSAGLLTGRPDAAPAEHPAARPNRLGRWRGRLLVVPLALLIVAAGVLVWRTAEDGPATESQQTAPQQTPGAVTAPELESPSAAPSDAAPASPADTPPSTRPAPTGTTEPAATAPAPGAAVPSAPAAVPPREPATPPVLRNTAGVNLALRQPAEASSVVNPSTPASSAVDGSLRTGWSSRFSDPQSISVDLGARWEVSRITIVWGVQFATAYQVEVSDDQALWTPVFRTVFGRGGPVTVRPGGVPARFVRVIGVRRGTGFGYAIRELDVR